MKTVAGVTYPCFDCKLADRVCRKKNETIRKVFFSIGTGRPVSCSEYEERCYHGIEGVTA